jgi:hypothetical protein
VYAVCKDLSNLFLKFAFKLQYFEAEIHNKSSNVMAGAALKPGYFYNHPFILDKTIFMRKQLNKYAAMREIINFIIVVLL